MYESGRRGRDRQGKKEGEHTRILEDDAEFPVILCLGHQSAGDEEGRHVEHFALVRVGEVPDLQKEEEKKKKRRRYEDHSQHPLSFYPS